MDFTLTLGELIRRAATDDAAFDRVWQEVAAQRYLPDESLTT